MLNDTFKPKYNVPAAAELFRVSVFSEVQNHLPFTAEGFAHGTIDPAFASSLVEDGRQRQAELETIRAIAFSEGFAAGKEDGAVTERKKTLPLLDRLATLISDLTQTRNTFLQRLERQSVQLSLAIAEKIIQHQLNIDPEVIIRAMNQALETVSDYNLVKIRLHPDDAEFLRESDSLIKSLMDQGKDITVIEDISIQRGGCLVETDFGLVDARIESRLAAVKEALETLAP